MVNSISSQFVGYKNLTHGFVFASSLFSDQFGVGSMKKAIKTYTAALFSFVFIIQSCNPPRELETQAEGPSQPKETKSDSQSIEKHRENGEGLTLPLQAIDSGQQLGSGSIFPLVKKNWWEVKPNVTWQGQNMKTTGAVCFVIGAAFFATHSWFYLKRHEEISFFYFNDLGLIK